VRVFVGWDYVFAGSALRSIVRWAETSVNSDFPFWQIGFAIVMEFGTHQRLPSHEEIKNEFNMTWKAFLIFLEKAPVAL
jgi:hypothetical protein